MRTIYIITILLLGELASAQNIQLTVAPATVNVMISQSQNTTLSISSSGGFIQQVFLTYSCLNSNCNGITLSFSQSPVNYPYSNVNIIITVTGFATIGMKDIQIRGANGPVSDSCVLHVNVLPNTCNFTHLYMNPNVGETVFARSNEVWLGGNNLILFSGGAASYYTTTNSQFPGHCNNIIQDSIGNLWLATDNGIAKFDGTYWTIFNMTNSPLNTNSFSSIAIDTAGNIWAASNIGQYHYVGDGIYKYDGSTWTKYDSTNTSLPSQGVSHITFDKNGLLWVFAYSFSSHEFQIYTYDGVNWNQPPFPNCVSLGTVTKIYFDSQNNAWFSNSNDMPERPIAFGIGLIKFDGLSVEMWSDSLISTGNHGKWDLSCNLLFLDSASKIQGPGVNSVFVDQYDRVWGGVTEADNGQGLIMFDQTNFTNFNSFNSQLGYPAIQNFAESNDTIYFINGIDLFQGSTLTAYSCGLQTSIMETIANVDYKIELYPNPASEKLHLRIAELLLPGNVKLYDVTGKKVFETAATFSLNEIKLNLPNGLYDCVYSNATNIFSKKLVVER